VNGHNRKLTIWITGSAGFLGTRLARYLTSKGHQVTGLSRRETQLVNKSVIIDLAADDACERLRDLIENAGPPDVLIHAASKQPGSGTLPDFIRSNVKTSRNMVETFRAQPPHHVIYTSTLSVYNNPATLPVKETEPAGGVLPYSATKRWSEQLWEGFTHLAPVIVLRLPSLYGAGHTESFIDGLAKQALVGQPIELFSRGEVIRDALHVSDAVKGIATCAENRLEGSFSLFNLGCGRRITTAEYARALVDALKSKSSLIPVDKPAPQPDLYADIAEARRAFGFEPMSLEESMRTYANELSTR